MTEDDRFRLLYGPYAAPPCAVGDLLVCERHGPSHVAEMSCGPIPWPASRRQGGRCLILCGELACAVRRESVAAVRHWWGVSAWVVWQWRKALGVPRCNRGTEALLAASLRERRDRLQGARTDLWTPEEDALLGTATDAEVARRVGRSEGTVRRHRQRLGIRPFGRRWDWGPGFTP
jgi:hypothetical protein